MKARPVTIALALVLGSTIVARAAAPAGEPTLLKAMREELARNFEGLRKNGQPPPYFVSYAVTDTRTIGIAAANGALQDRRDERARVLDVDVRVGDYALDNTRRIRGDRFGSRFEFPEPVALALEDDPAAIKAALWLETDRRYKAAVERLTGVTANKAVMVKEEDEAADFSRETPRQFAGADFALAFDAARWEKRIKEHSEFFSRFPEILQSQVMVQAEVTNKKFVSTEGAAIQHGTTHYRLGILVQAKAEDGMELYLYESFDGRGPDELPDDRAVRQACERLARDLLSLRTAPVMTPFTGPAILSGRAAAVFFHEIFGHRIEGHRQKDEDEGQTFTKKVGEPVLPPFLSVYDDPTREREGKIALNGNYLFDDEGVPAQKVTVVENGVLRNFLMSRSPIANFAQSNGHGRRYPGYRPVGRQGSLIVEASRTVPEDELRRLLVAEAQRQGKPYGLLFKDISGGFTMTGRTSPQAFQVTPLIVYRVYTDGRPDELVRGVNLIGTPLVSFSKILAAGGAPAVFNGYCGAESGPIPVSGVAPSILTGEIEVQKAEKSAERPPLLPPPAGADKEAER